MRKHMNDMVVRFGLPRIIIVGFFLLLTVGAGFFQMDLLQLLSDCLRRWGMYGVLTLAMVPAVQCGIGLNFGISMGIVGGLLGGLLVIEFHLTRIPQLVSIHPLLAQWAGILIAIAVGVVLAIAIGWLYGQLLNRVKGSEMTVTTYVGFSIIAFMNIMWTILPFRNGELIYPTAGEGLRNTISLADSYAGVMNNTLAITIQVGKSEYIFPTGLLLFFFFIRPVLMRRWKERHARLPKTNAEALIGRKGKVTEAIDGDAHTGRVQIDGDNFMARSADGETIPANAHVTVKGLDSTILIVKRYD